VRETVGRTRRVRPADRPRVNPDPIPCGEVLVVLVTIRGVRCVDLRGIAEA